MNKLSLLHGQFFFLRMHKSFFTYLLSVVWSSLIHSLSSVRLLCLLVFSYTADDRSFPAKSFIIKDIPVNTENVEIISNIPFDLFQLTKF